MQTKNKVTKLRDSKKNNQEKILNNKQHKEHTFKELQLHFAPICVKRPMNSKECSRTNASSILHVEIRKHNDNHKITMHARKIYIMNK
jgi:hypothetical protein